MAECRFWAKSFIYSVFLLTFAEIYATKKIISVF